MSQEEAQRLVDETMEMTRARVALFDRELIGVLAIDTELLAYIYAQLIAEEDEWDGEAFALISRLTTEHMRKTEDISRGRVLTLKENAIGELYFWLHRYGIAVSDKARRGMTIDYASRSINKSKKALLRAAVSRPARIPYIAYGFRDILQIDKAIANGIDAELFQSLYKG